MIKVKFPFQKVYEGQHGPHGWYWCEEAIASFLAEAFARKWGSDCSPYITFYVDPLVKLPAGDQSKGCHDTNYSVIARVVTNWGSGESYPTAEEVAEIFNKTTAQFEVERIAVGYHFYKTW